MNRPAMRMIENYDSWAKFERDLIFASYPHNLWPLITGTEETIEHIATADPTHPDFVILFNKQSIGYRDQQKRLAMARALLLDTFYGEPVDELTPTMREQSHPAVLYKELERVVKARIAAKKAEREWEAAKQEHARAAGLIFAENDFAWMQQNQPASKLLQ